MLYPLEYGVRQIQEERLCSKKCKRHGEVGRQKQGDDKGRESLLGALRDGLYGELSSDQPGAAGVRAEALRGDRGPGRAAVGGGRPPLWRHPLHWVWRAVRLGTVRRRGNIRPSSTLTLEVLTCDETRPFKSQTPSFRVNLLAVSGSVNELSVHQFWPTFGLDYTWIDPEKKNPSLQKRSDPVHVSVIICIKAWASLKQSAFQLGYQLSQTLFVTLSPSRCWLSVVGLIPQSKKSYQILPGIVMFLLASESLSRPLMLPRGQESLFLLRKLLIDPLHLEKALTWNLSLVIARSETHPAVQPLLVWQKAARGCRSPLMASLEILWLRRH